MLKDVRIAHLNFNLQRVTRFVRVITRFVVLWVTRLVFSIMQKATWLIK